MFDVCRNWSAHFICATSSNTFFFCGHSIRVLSVWCACVTKPHTELPHPLILSHKWFKSKWEFGLGVFMAHVRTLSIYQDMAVLGIWFWNIMQLFCWRNDGDSQQQQQLIEMSNIESWQRYFTPARPLPAVSSKSPSVAYQKHATLMVWRWIRQIYVCGCVCVCVWRPRHPKIKIFYIVLWWCQNFIFKSYKIHCTSRNTRRTEVTQWRAGGNGNSNNVSSNSHRQHAHAIRTGNCKEEVGHCNFYAIWLFIFIPVVLLPFSDDTHSRQSTCPVRGVTV